MARYTDIDKCNKDRFYKECGGSDSLITAESAFNMLEALPVEDVVSRDEVLKFVEQIQKLKDEYHERKENGLLNYGTLCYLCISGWELLDEAPEGNVRPVVLCKECMHWERGWSPSVSGSEGECHYCPTIDLTTEETFFCASGERGEVEHNFNLHKVVGMTEKGQCFYAKEHTGIHFDRVENLPESKE